MSERSHVADIPTAVDLFCGAGGLSLGIRQAGFRIISAVDVDPDSCESYRKNHVDVRLLEKDIRSIKRRDILGNRYKRVSVLAGCPPCQGFTRLNETSDRSDPRNGLVLEYMRLVRELEPDVIFFENVPGLLKNGIWYFNRLKGALIEEGYDLDSKVLQLADYGVPQKRRRLIVLGGRGFKLTFPEETHAPKWKLEEFPSRKPWRTVRRALKVGKKLGRAQSLGTLRERGEEPSDYWHVSRKLSKELVGRLRATPRSGGSREDLPRDYELECHSNFNGFHDVYGRLDWAKPSVTITGGCTNLSKGRFGHPELLRALTPREAALLQGFPKAYKFVGSGMESVCQQIGNALPPPFARKIGFHILKQLRAQGLVRK